jgi:hypothetical protein
MPALFGVIFLVFLIFCFEVVHVVGRVLGVSMRQVSMGQVLFLSLSVGLKVSYRILEVVSAVALFVALVHVEVKLFFGFDVWHRS